MCFISVAFLLKVRGAEKIAELANHVIVCGAEESFHNFIEQLRRCDPMRPPIVILHPKLPRSWSLLQTMFQPLHYVQVHTTCLCCCFPSFIHSFIQSSIHSSIHPSAHAFIHSFIYLVKSWRYDWLLLTLRTCRMSSKSLMKFLQRSLYDVHLVIRDA